MMMAGFIQETLVCGYPEVVSRLLIGHICLTLILILYEVYIRITPCDILSRYLHIFI